MPVESTRPSENQRGHEVSTTVVGWVVTSDPTTGGMVAEPVRVRVLAAQRCEPARIRSEKGICWGGRPLAAAA